MFGSMYPERFNPLLFGCISDMLPPQGGVEEGMAWGERGKAVCQTYGLEVCRKIILSCPQPAWDKGAGVGYGKEAIE